MKRYVPPAKTRSLGLLAAGVLALLLCAPSLFAAVYVHQSPVRFAWAPATGIVDHYNVYLSVDGKPFTQIAQAALPSYQLAVEDGRTYVLCVQAENGQATSPVSDPSDSVIAALNGSSTDTDGDGMPDAWERTHGLDPLNAGDAGLDNDGDALVNRDEFLYGTSPVNPDSDADGIPDGLEVQRGQNPADPVDNRPTANAGADQDLAPARVTLDGSLSRDPNGDPLSYSWTQLQGPAVDLASPRTPKPWFLGKKAGLYRFHLVVGDGKTNSVADDTAVTIRNVAPLAEAGPDQVVSAGSVVTLNGRGSSDPNEDTLRYAWSQTEGPGVPLEGDRQALCRFVPEASGVYRFALVVSDGTLSSTPDELHIIVHGLNHVPTAEAGPDQTVAVNTKVTLDGSGSSDPDGDPLTYTWSQKEGPALVFLKDALGARPHFVPVRVGVYRFQLIVNDGTDASAPDSVTLTVEGSNRAPVAVVDKFVSAQEGDWVDLNGQGSYDPDNDPLTYAWFQVRGPQVSLQGADRAKAGFYAMGSAALRFQLVVDDGELYSAPAVVEVSVDANNRLPAAHAGGDQTSSVGAEVCLDGSESYALNSHTKGAVGFSWFQAEGPQVTLLGSDTATPCFTPSSPGTYVFGLVVSQGEVQSAPDLVTAYVDTPVPVPDVLPVPAEASSSGCMSVDGGALRGKPGMADWLFVICLFLPAVSVWGFLKWTLRRHAR